MAFDIIAPFIGGSKSTGKRKLRYAVVVKGVRISRHSTKTLARKKAKGVVGARVVKIGASYRKFPVRSRKRTGFRNRRRFY